MVPSCSNLVLNDSNCCAISKTNVYVESFVDFFTGVNAICALSSQGLIPVMSTRIQKSNADEFIHIFVNNSDKLTEFLEHMIKVRKVFVTN